MPAVHDKSKGETMKQQTGTIDVEPTWVAICRMVGLGTVKAEELIPACRLADIIRQAQKSGNEKITFLLNKNGNISVEGEK